MALFSRKKVVKKTEEKGSEKVVPAKVGVSNSLATDYDLAGVIVRPHVTEKAVGMGDKNVYTYTLKYALLIQQLDDYVAADDYVGSVDFNVDFAY